MKLLAKIMIPIVALAQVILIANGDTLPKKHIDAPTKAVNLLIPGMFGFGEDVAVSRLVPYFGVLTGVDIGEELEKTGYESYQVNVGPASSAWDRACEMYAMLTGTRVDYGEAHSKRCGHDRYGRTYDKPLFEGWGAKRPVNLIGHSFGGNTARMFALLLADGSAQERAATPKSDRSPLFNGGKIDRVHAIVSLGAPHQGTTALGCVPNKEESDDYKAIGVIMNVMAGNRVINGVYDLQLDHFGIGITPGSDGIKVDREKAHNFITSLDHSFYDCSIEGAAAFNEIDRIFPSVYYFSYSSVVTQPTPNNKHFPRLRELSDPVLYFFSSQIGQANGNIPSPGPDWLENDGLIPRPSAIYPEGQPHQDFIPEKTKVEPGIWNVMPTVDGVDHAYWCGGDILRHSEEEIMEIYLSLMKRLEGTY